MMTREPVRTIIRPSPMYLPQDSVLARRPSRKVEQQQGDYLEKFDARTLFYDVFAAADGVVLSGPPLLNLKETVFSATWAVDGRPPAAVQLTDLDRTQHSRLNVEQASGSLHLDIDGHQLRSRIGENHGDLFAGRKAIFTKSKNNQLDWIKDWAGFHAREHGVDAVLLYDNGSTDYRCEDVLAALAAVQELATIVVVDWPFPFGPQGGNWEGLKNAPWDSDYCEYGILEHARHRFLHQAEAVLHHDIDELVLASDSRPVFEHLRASGAAAISYQGRWIETADFPGRDVPQFQDFRYFDIRKSQSTPKWAAIPGRMPDAVQWKTHRIDGVDMSATEQVVHRHFMGINSNWKRKRTGTMTVDPKYHAYDQQLAMTLERSLGRGRQPRAAVRGEAFQIARLMSELSRVHREMRAGCELPPGFVRQWFYSRRVLVFDYELDERRFAFDLAVSADGWRLTVEGRSDAAWYAVRKATAGRGRLVAGKAKLELRTWTSTAGAAEIIPDAVADLQWVVGRLADMRRGRPQNAIDSYWWDQRNNFGDLIGPWLIEMIAGRPAYNTIGEQARSDALVTVGSLINQLQRPGMTIWGSGLIAPLHAESITRLKTRQPAAILAVRGWKTYTELTTKLGWSVPKVFGDPALLLPYFFQPPPGLASAGKVVLCAHYQHKKLFAQLRPGAAHIIDVERDAPTVVAELATASCVISTSLHGVIVAQAYGVPWLWLRVEDVRLAGDQFKFEDFFSTLEGSVASHSVSKVGIPDLDIPSLAGRAYLPRSNFNYDDLLASFPYPGASRALGVRGRTRQLLKKYNVLRALAVRARALARRAHRGAARLSAAAARVKSRT